MRSVAFKVGVLGGCVSLLAAGCATSGTTGETTTGATDSTTSSMTEEGRTVAFIPGISSDPFFLAMEIAAKDEAEKLGIDLLWQGSAAEYSPQTQIPFVDAALAQDIDVLILVPTDADALQASVDKAEEQGVPVITVDTTVSDRSYLTSHITGDNYQGGQLAAEEMVAQLPDGGKVLTLGASPTNTTGTQRIQGFEEAAEDTALQALPAQYAYSQPAQATSIVNATLLEHDDLAGIFAADGTTCTGAVAGLQNAGKVGEVSLICYDAYSNQVADLESGIVTALIAQDPAQEARLSLQYANALMTGEGTDDIEAEVVIPNVVMNSDNLDETRQYQYAEEG